MGKHEKNCETLRKKKLTPILIPKLDLGFDRRLASPNPPPPPSSAGSALSKFEMSSPLPMRETHLPLMSRGGWIFLKQHLAWQITLEKQTFAKAAEATHTSWDEINYKGAI